MANKLITHPGNHSTSSTNNASYPGMWMSHAGTGRQLHRHESGGDSQQDEHKEVNIGTSKGVGEHSLFSVCFI